MVLFSAAVLGLLLLVSSLVVWFALPVWAAEFILTHSPSLTLTLRSAEKLNKSDELKLRLSEWKHNVPALCAALENGTPWQRRMLAWYLGELKDPQAIDALIGSLAGTAPDNEERLARLFAANALVQIGDPRAVPALIEALPYLYPDQRRERKSLLLKIAKIGHPDLFNIAYRHYLSKTNPDTQNEGCLLLHAIRDPRVFAVLDAKLGLGTNVGFDDAEEALGRSPHPEALTIIQRALQDPNPARRWGGANAAMYNRDPSLLAPLIALASDATQPLNVREAAGFALGYQHDKLAVMTLDQLIRQGGKLGARAALALGKNKASDAMPLAMSLLSHPEAEVRARLVQALGERGEFTPELTKQVEAMLNDPDPNVVHFVERYLSSANRGTLRFP